ncbi:MAG: exosortase/archaeosortase family protein [Deltaproteobacteria bacterium]|nr:exosortase/archaeosortase family protein [Deltaproteobacteria bacterium]
MNMRNRFFAAAAACIPLLTSSLAWAGGGGGGGGGGGSGAAGGGGGPIGIEGPAFLADGPPLLLFSVALGLFAFRRRQMLAMLGCSTNILLGLAALYVAAASNLGFGILSLETLIVPGSIALHFLIKKDTPESDDEESGLLLAFFLLAVVFVFGAALWFPLALASCIALVASFFLWRTRHFSLSVVSFLASVLVSPWRDSLDDNLAIGSAQLTAFLLRRIDVDVFASGIGIYGAEAPVWVTQACAGVVILSSPLVTFLLVQALLSRRFSALVVGPRLWLAVLAYGVAINILRLCVLVLVLDSSGLSAAHDAHFQLGFVVFFLNLLPSLALLFSGVEDEYPVCR